MAAESRGLYLQTDCGYVPEGTHYFPYARHGQRFRKLSPEKLKCVCETNFDYLLLILQWFSFVWGAFTVLIALNLYSIESGYFWTVPPSAPCADY